MGSFAGVVIDRIPRGLSIVYPPSSCNACHKKLRIWHNIPIISCLALRCRCHFCGSYYGKRSLMLEIIFALSLLALYSKYGFSFALVENSLLVLVLVCLAYIDLDTFSLPHSLLLALYLIGILSGLIYYLYPDLYLRNDVFSLVDRLLGCVAGGLGFAVVNIIATYILRRSKRLSAEQWAMGWGDPVLLAGIGLLVGASKLIMVVLLASLVGSIVGIIGKYRNQEQPHPDIADGAIPYGPFLALAAIYVYLF